MITWSIADTCTHHSPRNPTCAVTVGHHAHAACVFSSLCSGILHHNHGAPQIPASRIPLDRKPFVQACCHLGESEHEAPRVAQHVNSLNISLSPRRLLFPLPDSSNNELNSLTLSMKHFLDVRRTRLSALTDNGTGMARLVRVR